MANCRIQLKSGGYLLQTGGVDQSGPWFTYKTVTGCIYTVAEGLYTNLWTPLWWPMAETLNRFPKPWNRFLRQNKQ